MDRFRKLFEQGQPHEVHAKWSTSFGNVKAGDYPRTSNVLKGFLDSPQFEKHFEECNADSPAKTYFVTPAVLRC
jgi:hypothetical protein